MKKMTLEERDNTRWNVIEVETAHNVPQAAKLVLSSVKYTDLPDEVVKYLMSLHDTDPYCPQTEAGKLSAHLRAVWNGAFEWEQEHDDVEGYWMGSSAFDHWHTNVPRKPPTCDLQVSHYLFFQMVATR